MPEGFRLASAWVSVSPDLTGFKEKMDAELGGDKASVKVPVELDKASVDTTAAKAKEVAKAIGDGAPVKARIELDDRSVAEFEAKIKALTAAASNSGGVQAGSAGPGAAAGGGGAAGGLIAAAAALGAGALGGGALLAVPAIFTAIGVAAEKSSPQVVQAFGDMTTAAKKSITDGFSPFAPALADLAGEAKSTIGGLEPQFYAASSAAAPLLQIVGHDFLAATQAGVGASVPILQSMQPVAQALGGDLKDLEEGVRGLLKNIDVSSAAQGLSALGTVVKDDLPAVGSLISDVAPLGNALLTVLAPALSTTVGELGFLKPVAEGVGSALQFLSPAISAVAGPVLGLELATKALTGSWTDYAGVATKLKSIVSDASGEFDKGQSTINALAKAVGFTTESAKAATVADLEAAAAKKALIERADEQVASEKAQAFAASGSAKAETELAAANEAAAASSKAAVAAEAELAAANEAASFTMGPLGIALGVVGGALALVGLNSAKAAPPVQDLTAQMQKLAGAAPDAVQGIISGDPALTKLINQAKDAGVSVSGLLAAYNQGPKALQAFSDSLSQQQKTFGDTMIGISQINGVNTEVQNKQRAQSVESIRTLVDSVNSGKVAYDMLDPSLKKIVDRYNEQNQVAGQLGTSIATLTQQQDAANAVTAQAAQKLQLSSGQQAQATGIANALGLSIGSVTDDFRAYAGGVTFGMDATQKLSDQFLSQTLAVDNANNVIGNYFKTANAGVASASQSLADANHSAAQSADAVSNAQHSLAQSAQAVVTAQQGVATAQRGVVTAEQGVTTAEQNLTRAQQSEQQAQVALTAARQAAAQQLTSLHLQLNDQVAAEDAAHLKLVEQTATSAAMGVTQANAAQLAGQTITETNQAQIQSAIDLVDAMNSVADTMNTGVNLRQQVVAADQAGVDQAPSVLSAQQALVQAQQQVASSIQAVGTAQQAVTDAQANVVKAEQGVTDAVYNEGQARKAVSDALYNQQKAIQAVATAQSALSVAQDNASRSMDIHTAAGQRNLAMLQQVSDQLFANEKPLQAANDLVNNTATLFGISTTAAQNYVKQVGLIPQNFQFSVTAMANADLTALNQAYSTMLARGVRPGPNSGIQVPFAEGGPVSGPGGPRDDVIPALLSDREFVQPAASHDYYGTPFMEAIRQKLIPKEALPRFASGGAVYDTLALGGAGDLYQAAVNTLGVLGVPSPPAPKSLPAYVAPALAAYAQFAGSSSLEGWIQQAIGITGVGQSWDGPLKVLIGRESSGNPNAINLSDSNAMRGDPSRGLMQTIGATFERYRDPRLPDNIYDPVANIVAGIRYIEADYGSIFGVQQANPYLPPKGYDGGGYAMPGDTLVRNQTGIPEMLLPPDMGRTLESINSAVGGGGVVREVHHHYNTTPITVVSSDPYAAAKLVTAEQQWNNLIGAHG